MTTTTKKASQSDAELGWKRRFFFTQEMKTAILNGQKTATTRDHQKPLGEYMASTGNWRRPESIETFALIDVYSNAECTWPYSLANWDIEGFDSLDAMMEFCTKKNFMYASAPHLYFHRFTVKVSVK